MTADKQAQPQEHDAAPGSRARVTIYAIFFLLIAAMAGYAPKAARKSVKSDFGRYYTGGCRAVRAGRIYDSGGDLKFGYLPVVAQVMAVVAGPCEWLARKTCGSPATSTRWLRSGGSPGPEAPTEEGLMIGAYVWHLVLCLSFLAVLAMILHMCRPASWNQALIVVLAGLIFSARFLFMNIRLGQMNMFVMLWAVLGCWLIWRGRDIAGGAAIAFAIALKIIPAGLFFWLLWRRNWRASISLSVCGLFLLLVVPMFTWGPKGGLEQVFTWFKNRHHLVTDLSRDQADGQSLSSMSNRFFSRVSAVTPRRGCPLYINVLDSPGLAKVIALLLALGALGVALFAVRGDIHAPPLRFVLEVGLMFLLLLMISPESRRAHFITAFFAVMALVRFGLEYGNLRQALIAVAVAFVCMSLTSSGIWGYGPAYYYMNAYGIVMAGCLVLFGGCWWALQQLGEQLGTGSSFCSVNSSCCRHEQKLEPVPSCSSFPGFSVVIPFHNEADCLPPLLRALSASLDEIDRAWEVLLVDDVSTDKSAQVAMDFCAEHPGFRLIRLEQRGGQTGAFARAFAEARGDYIIRMDADGQDDPRDLPRFLERIDEGAELVMGLRHQRKHRKLFRVASALYDLIILVLFDSPLHSNTGSFIAFKAELVKNINWRRNDHRYLPLIAMRRGAKNVSEVLVRHGERRSGESKYNPFTKIVMGLPELFAFLWRLRLGEYDF